MIDQDNGVGLGQGGRMTLRRKTEVVMRRRSSRRRHYHHETGLFTAGLATGFRGLYWSGRTTFALQALIQRCPSSLWLNKASYCDPNCTIRLIFKNSDIWSCADQAQLLALARSGKVFSQFLKPFRISFREKLLEIGVYFSSFLDLFY